ncbi:MAG: acyl-CoA/acyl-ACP dehydrogenase, partial [Chloroflexi bacterium]|nr:acyl-CoA/acyl-ACP dehydrogenase [Chloroflexota bacterium]
MDLELQALTEPGRRLVALAEEHAADFATRAEQHDREGSFPKENFEAMRESGMLMASLPEEYGGMGVNSLHDLGVGIGRLARGDASTAIALNMHLAGVWNTVRTSMGQNGAAAAAFLQVIGDNSWITAVANTEAGTDLQHPMTEATPAENGWLLNGRKIFGTVSPIANVFFVTVRAKESDGYQARTAVVIRGAQGLNIQDNWDALGMRGSGSGDVVFEDCAIPEASLVGRGEWGVMSDGATEGLLTGNSTLTFAFLGIAEAAQEHIIELVTTRHTAGRHAIQRLVAENEIDIAASRAMLTRTTQALDAYFAGESDHDALYLVSKDLQCTKWFVNRKAVDVVDRALTASGGSGYMSKSPLSRMYRDARAGSFMQPYSPNEAFEYIGKIALGLDP